MKKKFKVEVDCANCAAKMEDAIRKVEGVQSVSVNFMTQKMTIEADDENFDFVLDYIVRHCPAVSFTQNGDTTL